MKCPFCNSEDTKVVDSRSFMDGYSIKRRRECIKCEKRFTTFEKVEETPLFIVKKDKRRDRFDRNKLMRGLVAATVKRNISRESLETFVLEIEKTIQNYNSRIRRNGNGKTKKYRSGSICEVCFSL